MRIYLSQTLTIQEFKKRSHRTEHTQRCIDTDTHTHKAALPQGGWCSPQTFIHKLSSVNYTTTECLQKILEWLSSFLTKKKLKLHALRIPVICRNHQDVNVNYWATRSYNIQASDLEARYLLPITHDETTQTLIFNLFPLNQPEKIFTH